MATCIHHPKRAKDCAFCKFWIGDAQMRFVNANVGYELQVKEENVRSGTVLLPLRATPVLIMYLARTRRNCYKRLHTL